MRRIGQRRGEQRAKKTAFFHSISSVRAFPHYPNAWDRLIREAFTDLFYLWKGLLLDINRLITKDLFYGVIHNIRGLNNKVTGFIRSLTAGQKQTCKAKTNRLVLTCATFQHLHCFYT